MALVSAQDTLSVRQIINVDSLSAKLDSVHLKADSSAVVLDSMAVGVLKAVQDSAAVDSAQIKRKMRKEQRALARANFIPNPEKSLWLALTFPGLGQIYNRKYWKVPIVYGCAVGIGYAISYYGTRYNDYRHGYRDFSDADPNTNYHLELIPKGYPESNAGTYVKTYMDNYRRYRDIFIAVGVAVYALSVVDAYVDAQLAEFDVSPDLSMKVRPKLDTELNTNTPTIGCQMQLNF